MRKILMYLKVWTNASNSLRNSSVIFSEEQARQTSTGTQRKRKEKVILYIATMLYFSFTADTLDLGVKTD